MKIRSGGAQKKAGPRERYFSSISEASLDGMLAADRDGRIIEVNTEYCALSGYAREELLTMGLADLAARADGRTPGSVDGLQAYEKRRFLDYHRRKDGTIANVEISAAAQVVEGDELLVLFVRDLQKKEEEVWRELTRNALLELFALRSTMKEYLDSVVNLLGSWSGCQCVGIRLIDENGEMPYVASAGLDGGFLDSESWLSLRTDQCTCMRTVLGTPAERERDHLTGEGSFYCNNTAAFTEELTEEERKLYRGACERNGYRSVAVIPLCHQEKILGAIHLADEREGAVPLRVVTFIQSIAPVVGEAISRFSMEVEQKNNFESQKIINDILRLTIDNLPLDEILDRSLGYIFTMPWLAGESSGCILLVEGSDGELSLKAHRGLPEDELDDCPAVKRSNCMCGGSIESGEIRFIRHDDTTEHADCIHEGSYGRYCVPLVSSGDVLGILIINFRNRHHPNKTSELYLSSIATTLAGIIIRTNRDKELQSLTLAVEQSSDWIYITDREGTIEYTNNIVESITGYSKKEIVGSNPRIMKSGKHDETFYNNLWETVLSGQIFRSVFINRKKNGDLFYLDNSITPLLDDGGLVTHFIVSGKDITHQKQMEDQLVSLVHYDMLTGLPNRTLFMDRLKLAMSRAEYKDRLIAVLIIDLDKFKIMNDSFGPEIGDEILKYAAGRLGNVIREGDILARLGGDEFGMALVDVAHKEDFILIVEKIRAAISLPMAIKGHDVVLTVSIGISIYPFDGNNAFTIMHNADIAFSRLKTLGSNNYQFYTADMNLKASEFMFIEQQLFSAVNNKNKDFVIHYQPYYEINTKRLVGMESLLRWNNGGSGLTLPDAFIPILEETGMIIPVGMWIIQSVCGQIKEWIGKGYSVVPVSINISPAQFRQKDLVSMIEKTVMDYGIDPSRIVFELTENMLMHDLEYASSILRKFRERGFAISIDDFGMGYSSLSYLKRFAINNIKIDKSFIRDITTEPDSGSIVTAIISVAHSLNLKAIAEGVETVEQFNILRILRCDIIQGFYFSEPVPSGMIEGIYRAGTGNPEDRRGGPSDAAAG